MTCDDPRCLEPTDHPRRDMCVAHYTQWRKTQMPPCTEEDCEKPQHSLKAGLCSAHYYLLRKYGTPSKPVLPTVEERFWAFVNKTDTCWLWTGGVNKGYGVFAVTHDGQVYAHRFAYELLVGPIPEGHDLDHVWPRCTSRACVRAPDHLEPVTLAENNRRAAAKITHCPQEHEYTPENTYITKDGKRQCRTCTRIRWQKNNAKRKAERHRSRLSTQL